MTDSTAIAWAGSIDGMGAPIVGALVGFCGVFGDFMWIEWEFLNLEGFYVDLMGI
jgi:hypothetical protein